MRINKAKGVFLIFLGIAWLVFVYKFDSLMNRPRIFGTKAVIGFGIGVIMLVNGIRIYRRKE